MTARNITPRLQVTQYAKTYKTEDNATKAITKAIDKYGVDIKFLIFPQPDGRFLPVVLSGYGNTQEGIYLAHDGFMMVGA